MPRILNKVLYLNMWVQSSPSYLAAIIRNVCNSDNILWLLLNKKFKKVLILEIYVWYVIIQTGVCFKLKYFISLASLSRFPTNLHLKYIEYIKEMLLIQKNFPNQIFGYLENAFFFPRPYFEWMKFYQVL